MNKDKWLKIGKIVGIVLLGLLLVWFAGIRIHTLGLFGKTELSDQMRTDQSVFFKLDSSDKKVSGPIPLLEGRRMVKEIWDEDVDLSVKIPRKKAYRQALVEVTFSPHDNSFLILGTKSEAEENKVTKTTLYNSFLHENKATNNLLRQENEENVLFSKKDLMELSDSLKGDFQNYTKKNPASIVNLDEPNYLGLYGFDDIGQGLKIKDIALKGTHRFYTYTDKGEVYFKIRYFDTNKKEGPDRINLRIKQGKDIHEYVQGADDGDESASGKNSKERSAKIRYTGAATGVYEFEADISDDVIITGIESNLSNLVLKDKVKLLGDKTNKKMTLYTGEGELELDSKNGQGGTVKFGNGSIKLEKGTKSTIAIPKARKEGLLLMKKEIQSIEFPDEDLDVTLKTEKNEETGVVEGTYLSFSKDSYLDFQKINFLSRDEIEEADFVIARKDRVSSVLRDGNWVTARETFSLTDKSFEDDLWYLRLKREEDGGSYLLDSISVTFVK